MAFDINIDSPQDATQLDHDEAHGLIPKHIVDYEQLNEWELTNVLKGERWVFSPSRLRKFARPEQVFTSEFIRTLHKRMFGDTWKWAGVFRNTEKNIGIDPIRIQPALADLCADVQTQLEFASYPLDEIAARLSHRLVAIHPFANGNGRLSRTIADVLLVDNGAQRFSWGAANLVNENETRQRYLDALRNADKKNIAPLMAFVRS